MYTIKDHTEDQWVVITDDFFSLKFDIIHLQTGEELSTNKQHIRTFSSEEKAILFIRKYIPYYTKQIDTSGILVDPLITPEDDMINNQGVM
jgi:hypothetical protein